MIMSEYRVVIRGVIGRLSTLLGVCRLKLEMEGVLSIA